MQNSSSHMPNLKQFPNPNILRNRKSTQKGSISFNINGVQFSRKLVVVEEEI